MDLFLWIEVLKTQRNVNALMCTNWRETYEPFEEILLPNRCRRCSFNHTHTVDKKWNSYCLVYFKKKGTLLSFRIVTLCTNKLSIRLWWHKWSTVCLTFRKVLVPRASTDLHRRFSHSRLFWALIVCFGLGLLGFQVMDNVLEYLRYPVTVNVKINYNTTIRFPAVTICNQNDFR